MVFIVVSPIIFEVLLPNNQLLNKYIDEISVYASFQHLYIGTMDSIIDLT